MKKRMTQIPLFKVGDMRLVGDKLVVVRRFKHMYSCAKCVLVTNDMCIGSLELCDGIIFSDEPTIEEMNALIRAHKSKYSFTSLINHWFNKQLSIFDILKEEVTRILKEERKMTNMKKKVPANTRKTMKKLPIRLGEEETHTSSIPISRNKRELRYFLKKLPKKDLDKDPKFVKDVAEGQLTENILDLLAERKMTIEDLSKKIHKTKAYTHRAVYHPFHVSVDMTFAIANAMGLRLKIDFVDSKIISKAEEFAIKQAHVNCP